MKQSCASWIPRVLTVVMLSAITFGVAAKPPKPTHEDPINSASLNDEQARNFVALLSDVVQGVLARQGRTDAFISVRLDKSHSRVVIDLTQDYLPQGQRNFGSELQDRLHTITTEIVQMANFDLKIIVENVDYTFDGQGLHFYYPEDFSVQDGDPLSGSEPWLLKDLRPYMLDDLPPVDQSCSLLQRSLAELDLMLVDVGPLDGWEKVDPVGASQAEQGSLRALSKSALPQSLALLFAIAHVATWRRPPLLHQPPSKIITTAYDAVDQFASSLHRRGFSDADMIGGIVGRVLHSAVANIHYWGARTMPAGAMVEFPRLGDRIVLLPRSDGMKSALRKLHSVGIYGVEMLLRSIRDGRSTEFRQEELEIAASSLLSGSLSAQESLLEQADALFS